MTIHFDATAQVYELFDAEHNWVGAYDTYQEANAARRYDRDHEQDDTPCLDTSFHRHEMDIDTSSDLAWDRWCERAQKQLGVTSLDGDETEDGFSLDSAYEAFAAGRSPADYTDGR